MQDPKSLTVVVVDDNDSCVWLEVHGSTGGGQRHREILLTLKHHVIHYRHVGTLLDGVR